MKTLPPQSQSKQQKSSRQGGLFCALPLALALLFGSAPLPAGGGPCTPPFSGTIFIDPDIILPTDPTTHLATTPTGQGQRTVFDRRSGWITMNAYLFEATYSDGPPIEVQVNPEFGSVAAAEGFALQYASAVGQLPRVLREDIDELWIHAGVFPFGGGNDSILIHTGQGANYIANGILEETLVHEAVHTSLDAVHGSAPAWLAAQAQDNCFISTYARDNPTTEDVAESYLTALAVTIRADRISTALAQTIEAAIPARLAYFAAQDFDLFPLVQEFRRGDSNLDGSVNLADAIAILDHLFGGSPIGCEDAGDSNDDGALNLADPIFLLGYLFSGESAPSAPGLNCGTDPSADSLSCAPHPCS